ncbi:hypothetical protein RND81_06G181900 [Saponaria officinalis]|uniref:YTH domain-containing family protein n=1 Tax=Saponaria officinalis TaxID=3572 RepID=A0AAW1KCC5_SAPOF
MVCGEPVEKSNGVDSGLILPNSAEPAVAVPENGVHSDATSSSQNAASAHDAQNRAANYYNYYYPGYDASFSQSSDDRDHQNMGAQADQTSVSYYYNPYAGGSFVGADGSVSQPYYTSTGYVQNTVTYGEEATPCYSRDRNSVANPSNGSNTTQGTVRSNLPPPQTSRPNGIKPSQLYGSLNSKPSVVTSNSKPRPSVAPSNYSQSKVNKAGSYYPTNCYANAFHQPGNCQQLSYQRQSSYGNHNVRTWSGNDNKLRSNRKSEFETSTELTCGPRVNNRSPSDSSEKEFLTPAATTKKYNSAEFQIEYEAAKCFIIKSYSEDDVQKSIKYDVWSSTASGNKKLDAAFHDAEVKADETGKPCPVFLFFSVNGSGQFVGVAEMIGKVDFNKTMDFWQMDKWCGFFPVKWHIVKDVPNNQLRHILLENNDNRPVTYTRDTQEVGLKQASEMLKIFKSYKSKTCLLDDFDFYENRKMGRINKSSSHPTDRYGNRDLPKGRGGEEVSKSQVSSVSALVKLTNNLSLNGRDSKLIL